MLLATALGLLCAVSAAAGALVSYILQSIGRVICGIRVTYEPI
jgi:hypothetical protein